MNKKIKGLICKYCKKEKIELDLSLSALCCGDCDEAFAEFSPRIEKVLF